MQNIHTETKWLWSVREDYTHLQCEASSIAPKVSAAQSSRNGYFPHWNFWLGIWKVGEKICKINISGQKIQNMKYNFFFKRNWENHHLPRSFPILWRKKKFQVVRHHFSRTLSTTHTKLSMHLGKLICRSNKKSWIRLIFFDPNTVIYIV